MTASLADAERWYVAQTHVRAEPTALANLLRQGFVAYLPRYRRRRRHARRQDWVAAPLFPRYLFIRLDLATARWRSILSTIGISQVICQDARPLAVPAGVVETIRARENGNGLLDLDDGPHFAVGDRVVVTEGAFAECEGLFHGGSDDERVCILLTLLGRPIKVNLPATALRRQA